MRTLRLSLVGTVIVLLLGGLSGAVVAQTTDDEEPDLIPAAYFTGAWGEEIATEPVDEWEWQFGPGGGHVESLGHEHVVVFEASDPRISGTWTQVVNMRSFTVDPHEDIFVPVGSSAMRIVNEAGAWAGFYDGYYGDLEGEWYQVEGEDGYEGLTAVFRWKPEDDSYEGVIFSGVPPEHPAPLPTE